VKTHRNEPAWLPWIVGTLATARGEHPDFVSERTTENARRLFRIPAPGG
jgi:TatD DNase family protein